MTQGGQPNKENKRIVRERERGTCFDWLTISQVWSSLGNFFRGSLAMLSLVGCGPLWSAFWSQGVESAKLQQQSPGVGRND